jgi:hypothetical protein
MSFDFAVWEGPAPASQDEGFATFEALSSQYLESETPLPATAAIVAFLEALKAEFPGDTDEEFEAAPWVTWPLDADASGPIVYSGVRWPRAEDMNARITELATQMGLVHYDPQADSVATPLGASSNAATTAKKRSWWRR